MKRSLALLSAAVIMMVGLNVSAGSGQPTLGKTNYVVIGAFSVPKNAIEFTEMAKQNHLDAHFSINPGRKLFYVFVMHTDNIEAAIVEAKKLRKETSYFDTWVYSGTLDEDEPKGKDINPITREQLSHVNPADKKETIVLASTGNIPVIEPIKTTSVEKANSEIVTAPEGSKPFYFKIESVGKQIGGDVDVLDLDKANRKLAAYRGNETVNLKPFNQSGNISLVCEVFGYRKVQQSINFNAPQNTEGVAIDEDNKITVSFELVRLKKGDVAVMYNVYFFKDAAIMRPESKYEVTSLLEMLEENPNYKIKIHGHTNGNAHGKIISMGESKNFFALTDTKTGFGSAKKLSEERARVIQNYLIEQGINPSRMQIKAWGGKHPIYEKDSQQARANVRVEIEILED
ncbi:MAG: OmpA family protein [Bacteroidetes bacterium]|nr:OmpA family protein [Bacteroidota bacterium]